jgi:hypothetical protein
MPDIKNFYVPTTDLTVTIAGLPTSSDLLTGRQTSEVVNTTLKAIDYLVSGRFTTGASPTGGSVELWAVAAFDDTGATYPDNFTNAGDAARLWTNAQIKSGVAKLLWSVSPTTASNIAYPFSGISVAGEFGGTCPPRFVMWIGHSTGVNANATAGNHFIRVQPVYQTVG